MKSSRTLKAKTVITLESTTGTMSSDGTLTLTSGRGIVVHDNLQVGVTGTPIVLNADNELAGAGTLTVSGSKYINSYDGPMQITAYDMDVSGALDAGSAIIS